MTFPSRRRLKLILAIMLPFLAALLQSLFWEKVPYVAFFLFFPAVFFSSWLGGRCGGVVATLFSVALVKWLFLKPTHTFIPESGLQAAIMFVFAAVGFLIAQVHYRLEMRSNELVAAQASTEEALRQVAQSEAWFRQSEERLRLAVDGARLGSWHWDVVANEVVASDICCVQSGLPPSTVMTSERFLSLLNPEDREPTERAIRRAIDEQCDYQAEYRVQWPDGSERWIAASGRAYYGDSGTLLRLEGVTGDITARKHAEEEILRLNAGLELKVKERTAELVASQERAVAALDRMTKSEALYRAMVEQAPLGVALTDSLTGRIYEVNERFAEIAGRSREELAAIDWMRITHSDDLPAKLQNLARMRSGEISGFQMNSRWIRPDGEVVWVSLTCAPVLLSEGARHLAMVEEITERKKYELELKQARDAAESANRAKSEFLANVSHEIRTPMNAVLGLAQLLEQEPLSPNQREMLLQIRASGQSLLGILNDLLDFAKIEAGQLRIESLPFALAPLLDHLDSLQGKIARVKGLTFRIEMSPLPTGCLIGDPLRLEQILLNLVGNALKFTEQGEITVRILPLELTSTFARLRFETIDTGIGIALEKLALLFSPFSQADGSISRRFGGTGLGLSICRRLVNLMGGEIGVESREREGSIFWFELPFGRADDAALPLSPSLALTPPVGPRLAGRKILVVDDNSINLDLIDRVLTLEKADTTLAYNGLEALSFLKRTPREFDAVLMDVQMPVMDGLTATRLIRQELGLTALPIIAVTAGVLQEERQKALEAGVNDFLPKPVKLEEMVALLLRWIGASVAAEKGPAPAAVSPTPEEVGEESAPASGFPEIPGIDSSRLRLIFGNNRGHFLKLLGLFISQFGDATQQIRTALADGDRSRATRLLHNLRGTAGNLGALELMRCAQTLEQEITDGQNDPFPLLEQFAAQFAPLIEASAPWLRARCEPAPLSNVAPVLDPLLLKALRSAVKRNDLSALELFATVEPALAGFFGQEECRAMAEAIATLRFDKLLTLLERRS